MKKFLILLLFTMFCSFPICKNSAQGAEEKAKKIIYKDPSISKIRVTKKTKKIRIKIFAKNGANTNQAENFTVYISNNLLNNKYSIDNWMNEQLNKKVVYSKNISLSAGESKLLDFSISVKNFNIYTYGTYGIDIMGEKSFFIYNPDNKKKLLNGTYLATNVNDSINVLKKYSNLNVIFEPSLLLNSDFYHALELYMDKNKQNKYYSLPYKYLNILNLPKTKNSKNFYNIATKLSNKIVKKSIPKYYNTIERNIYIGSATDHINYFLKTTTDIFSLNANNSGPANFYAHNTSYDGFSLNNLEYSLDYDEFTNDGKTVGLAMENNHLDDISHILFTNSTQIQTILWSKSFNFTSEQNSTSQKISLYNENNNSLQNDNTIKKQLDKYKRLKNYSLLFSNNESFLLNNVQNIFLPFSLLDEKIELKSANENLENIFDKLTINRLKNIKIVTKKIQLPISIKNSFHEKINVIIKIVPRNWLLSVGETSSLKIGRFSSSSAMLDLTANGNGSGKIEIQILNSKSKLLKSYHEVLSVQSDSEKHGIIIFSIFLSLLLILTVCRFLYLKKIK